MLGFVVILVLVNICLLLIIGSNFSCVEEKVENNKETLKKLDEKLFGRKMFIHSSMFGCFNGEGRDGGLFEKIKKATDNNNDYLFTKIKALEDYLKINYIDEKLITNGEEKSSFKGYRKIEKKNS